MMNLNLYYTTRLIPYMRLISMKTSVIDKIYILFILGICIIKITFTKLFFKNSDLNLGNLLNAQLKGKVLRVPFMEFDLLLTQEEIIQGLADYEREAYIPFEQFIQKGDIVCDVGANIGTHTLKLAKLVGVSGRVIAIEPNLHNFGLLCLNISINNFSNIVTAIPAALASNTGQSKLYKLGQSMYFSLVRESNEFEIVDTINLSAVFERTNIEQIDFMKIDIEGAEEDLLMSEVQIFADHNIKMLFVDAHKNVNYNRIVGHLAVFGYRHKIINDCHLFYLP